ncbi:MAG: PQQ-dependent sugar dehydrogenase [Bacteroidia bacterium]
MKNIFLFLTILAISAFVYKSHAQDPEIILDPFATGLNMITEVTHAGDSRLFVTEQPGLIRIVTADGDLVATPFLDISARVEDEENEQGLLGLAFHPDFKTNGYFYVNYTSEPDGATHISRFSVAASDSNVADPGSELILLTQSQPFENHNAGALHFGPDGYLYFGLGDGGSAGDPEENAQDGSTLLGKMMRIDVDGTSPYEIPATNPFVGNPAVLDEIWAMSLRNPFRFSFDRQTGDMWLPDVGQDDWEEINFEAAGGPGGMNWGWDCYEGDHSFEPQDCGSMGDYDFPVFEYPNNATYGCAILGG